MSTDDNGDARFPNRDCPVTSGSMFKSSNVTNPNPNPNPSPNPNPNPFFGSGWDPLVSLSQSENFGGSSSVPCNEFNNNSSNSNPAYSSLENHHQAISGFSHLVHYQSDSGLGEMVPKLPCFGGSGSYSEMVGSFGLSDCGQLTNNQCPPNYTENNVKFGTNLDGSSPGGKKKRGAEKNVEGDEQKDGSEESLEHEEKKQRIERAKQTGKQIKDNNNNNNNSDSGEAPPPKENYIHVRAKRGQATNSHSLAERVRRERISERMRLLQELVPGCNKITGKAVMLDEIINYVQSLQQQVEFLSMKLATVNPEINIDMERILSKDILHARGTNASILGFPGLSSHHHQHHPYSQGMPSTTLPFNPLPQIVWDNELQTLLQMGFDSNPAVDNMRPTGRSKLDL